MKNINVFALSAALLGATGASAAGFDRPADIFAAPAVPDVLDFGDARFGVNLGVSTLGFTIEPTIRFGDRFGLRAPIGTGSFEHEEESEGSTYSGDLDIGGVGLLADYFPTGNGFHVSAGVIRTFYEADFLGQGIEIEGETSDIAVTVDQRREVSPILAVGYEAPVFGRVVLSASAGAIFGEGFDVTGTDPTGTFTQEQIDAEIEDIRDMGDELDIVPYVKLALGVRF